MSVRAMNAVWQESGHKGSCLLVLLVLADHAHEDGDGAYPSVATIARMSRLSERNVQYVLRALVASGEVTARPGEGPKGQTIYQIKYDKLGTNGRGGAKFSGVQSFQGCNQAPIGVQHGAEGVQPVAPEPLKEPSLEPFGSSEEEPGNGPSIASQTFYGQEHEPDTFSRPNIVASKKEPGLSHLENSSTIHSDQNTDNQESGSLPAFAAVRKRAWEMVDGERNEVAGLGAAFAYLFGRPLTGSAEYARLGKLRKDAGGKGPLMTAMLAAAAERIDGNPLDYLTRVVVNDGTRASPGRDRMAPADWNSARRARELRRPVI